MSSHANQPVCPTVTGVTIESTADALKIVKACQKQYFHCVPRRPLDNERSELIKSGHVFVYEENESRIKRWTDSIRWSPSRAMTNLLVYREVFDKFKPGGRRVIRPNARNPRMQPYSSSGRPSSRGHDQGDGHLDGSPSPQEMGQDLPVLDPLLQALRPEERKAVVGSLHDSYLFKEDGLCKKTLAVTIDQYKYHIVAYFKISDVLNKILRRPEEIYPFLREIDVRGVAEMNPRYKHHIDVSGRYDKDGQPLYDDDKDGMQDTDVYDSGSSDMGDIQHQQEPPPERQLPLPLRNPHGGYRHEIVEIPYGHQQVLHQHQQQHHQHHHHQQFLQQQSFPPLQHQHIQQQMPTHPHMQQLCTMPFQQLSEAATFQPLQEPAIPQDSNLFALYPQTEPIFHAPAYQPSQEQSRSMLPAHEPRSMPNESVPFPGEPPFPYRRPANMEPSVQHFSNNTELKNYQFAKKRDEDGGTPVSNFRQPVAPITASESRLPEQWNSGGIIDNYHHETYEWEA